MPVIEQKTTNKNKVDFDLNRLDKSKTTIFSKYPKNIKFLRLCSQAHKRKNWLFANTPGGAQASSVIYSLIETAKENGLDPYRYLLWLLQNAPGLSETDEA